MGIRAEVKKIKMRKESNILILNKKQNNLKKKISAKSWYMMKKEIESKKFSDF